MCDTCRAVGYWFPTGPACVDCAVQIGRADQDQARAEGYAHGDVCALCRTAARAVLDVLADRAQQNGPPL
ncbi:hypothetical protein [Streptomyces sp. CAI-85]|uniref:hypothetical protein n=1 Tax=Streptomyces sp. CAI-85 TaxID=1472662 RepID=UPI00158761B2|nr:hypothetical protein [Streptomyces sp. CAI-85]NUV64312.1 hypothetical protein [Streptomyces sp. CAI-85]